MWCFKAAGFCPEDRKWEAKWFLFYSLVRLQRFGTVQLKVLMQIPLGIELFSLLGNPLVAWGEHLSVDRICPPQCPVGKSIWAPSDAACLWRAQHLKGCKVYSLSTFLFLFCQIKAVILLNHLLSSLSYWDRKIAPCQLSFTSPPHAGS